MASEQPSVWTCVSKANCPDLLARLLAGQEGTEAGAGAEPLQPGARGRLGGKEEGGGKGLGLVG